ncbi:ubiquinol--cytochrome-c reductase subunit 8 [Sporobolomyces salmoneus]|uniref:ubiquinol--cytochrome-c reductase subunit 8 n=1 Tax=Sporobolomyces salmoneus TaxID=183962 RepID=UPI00317D780B
MRSSAPVSSGMPTGHKYMGWWGDMGGPKQKGIATYTLSPFRQDPMRGAYKHWAVNGAKRLGQQAVYFAVPFGLGYALIQWAIKDNHLRNSKHGQAKGLFP